MCPPDDLDSAADATASELSRYEDAFQATLTVLDQAIRSLQLLMNEETSSKRRNALGAKITELEGERNDLLRANIAFHSQFTTMVPPPVALVNELFGLAEEAAALTKKKTTAAAALRLVTKALNKFAEVQDIADGEDEEADADEGGNGGPESRL